MRLTGQWGNNENNNDVNTLGWFEISTNLSWNFKAMGSKPRYQPRNIGHWTRSVPLNNHSARRKNGWWENSWLWKLAMHHLRTLVRVIHTGLRPPQNEQRVIIWAGSWFGGFVWSMSGPAYGQTTSCPPAYGLGVNTLTTTYIASLFRKQLQYSFIDINPFDLKNQIYLCIWLKSQV